MRAVLLLMLVASFGGCANFTVNGTICDQINTEPNTQNIPKECRKYNEKDADKAFHKDKEDKKADVDSIIEFEKNQEENR